MLLGNKKSKINKEQQKWRYEIKCDCSTIYIGQIGYNIKQCISEHKKIKQKPQSSTQLTEREKDGLF